MKQLLRTYKKPLELARHFSKPFNESRQCISSAPSNRVKRPPLETVTLRHRKMCTGWTLSGDKSVFLVRMRQLFLTSDTIDILRLVCSNFYAKKNIISWRN